MFCTNCGAKLEDGIKFCTSCGTKIEGAFTESAVAMAQNLNARPEDGPAPMQTPQGNMSMPEAPVQGAQGLSGAQGLPPVYTPPQMTVQPPEAKKRKAWIPIVIAAAALLLVGIVLLGTAMLRMLKSAGNQDTEPTVAQSTESGNKKRDRDPDVDHRVDETEDSLVEPEFSSDEDPAVTQLDFSEDINITADTLVPVPDSVYAELMNLDSDFTAVNWQNHYSLKGAEKIVVSTAPFEAFGSELLAYAVTNLYDDDIELYGTITAYSADGEEVGEDYATWDALSQYGTGASVLYCYDGAPTGELQVDFNLYTAYELEGYWEADWGLSGNYSDGYLTGDYTLYNPTTTIYTTGYLTVFLLNDAGDPLGFGTDYVYRVMRPDATADGTIELYGDSDALKNTANAAMFLETFLADEEEIFLEEDGIAYFEGANGDTLFIRNNEDGTCSVRYEIPGQYTYLDPAADFYTGAVSFSDYETGTYVGSCYIYGGECTVYLYDAIVEGIDTDEERTLQKTSLPSSKKSEYMDLFDEFH